MIKSGNPGMSIIPFEPVKTRFERHEEAEQWDDINVAIPALFNFYHGVELTLKGMLDSIDELTEEYKNEHKLTLLLNQLKLNSELNFKFEELILKYAGTENQFKNLFNSNQITGNQFYEIFKYPETKKGKQYNYNTITHQGEISLAMFKELLDDINKIDSFRKNWWQANLNLIM